MKIYILTQPLHYNYGGIMQAYALQAVLRRLGHEPCTVDRREPCRRYSRAKRAHRYFKRLLRRMADRNVRLAQRYENEADRKVRLARIREFLDTRMTLTPEFLDSGAMTGWLRSCPPEAYVVGSDQVWRPCYSPDQDAYFLGFLPENDPVRRVAYAASFGTDQWEFSEDQTKRYRELAARFDAVSVRETSAVGMCGDKLGIGAVQTLDPTLLLERADYDALVAGPGIAPSGHGGVFAYILDRSESKSGITAAVSKRLGKPVFDIMADVPDYGDPAIPVRECVVPGVEQWLQAFADADAVVTDSFHGCVFSIIYRRPFVVIGNEGRGMARFDTLLDTFGLRDRLVAGEDDAADKVCRPIDWDRVEARLVEMRRKSMEFLAGALS